MDVDMTIELFLYHCRTDKHTYIHRCSTTEYCTTGKGEQTSSLFARAGRERKTAGSRLWLSNTTHHIFFFFFPPVDPTPAEGIAFLATFS